MAVSSGMAALHLAYLEMGVGPGDEVIVPALTHTATAHAVEMVGARPVFADCLPASGNMDVSTIEPLVTPRTKAIGLVHFIGFPCDLGPILALAARRGLKVVEDCAIAPGTRYDGTHVGLLGDAGAFSFLLFGCHRLVRCTMAAWCRLRAWAKKTCSASSWRARRTTPFSSSIPPATWRRGTRARRT